MRIIWDEPKRLANVLKHGFDFADLDQAYFDNSVVRPARPPRWFAFGRFDEKIIAVVFSPLGRQRMAKLFATDGPYAEAKEVIGGFLLIEARDMDEAVSLFDDDPILKYGRMEIRPLMVDHRHSETGEARPDFEPG